MENSTKNHITPLYGLESEVISMHLRKRYILEEDGRWHLHIIIDEFTTAEELRTSWAKIEEARVLLKLFQGSDIEWPSISFPLDLEQQKQKLSYGKLAMDWNFDALVYLIWANESSGDDVHKSLGYIYFMLLLQTIGMKNEEIEEYLFTCIEVIARDKLPWSIKDGIFYDQNIAYVLRKFNKHKGNDKIVIMPGDNSGQLIYIRWLSFVQGYWRKARELLQRNNQYEYKKYQKRLNERINELIEQSDNFFGLKNQ